MTEPNKTELSTKELLIMNIKDLMKIEKELKSMAIIKKQKNQEKKRLTEELIRVMKNNDIDCFDINGGSLVYKKTKTRKAVSAKFLLSQLEEILGEADFAKDVTNKVMANRVEVIKEDIKIKIDK